MGSLIGAVAAAGVVTDPATTTAVALDEIGWLEDLDVLDGRGLAARLGELERLQRRLEHAIVTVVGVADRRGVWAEDGHRGVRGWCQATVNWSGAETAQRIRCCKLFDGFDQVAGALASGEVGVAQVRELARARSNPRCGDQLGDVADVLLTHAKLLSFDEFRTVVVRWEALATPTAPTTTTTRPTPTGGHRSTRSVTGSRSTANAAPPRARR